MDRDAGIPTVSAPGRERLSGQMARVGVGDTIRVSSGLKRPDAERKKVTAE